MSEIRVRRPRSGDAAAIAATMADPQVFPGLMQMPFSTEEQWRKRIDEMAVGPAAAELFLVAELEGQLVGNAGLMPFTHVRRRHAMNLGIAVNPSAQGRGVGTALMQALIDWADNWAHVLRLELGVYVDNARAITLYERFGFVSEGIARAFALRDGVFADVCLMARLHPNPPRLPA